MSISLAEINSGNETSSSSPLFPFCSFLLPLFSDYLKLSVGQFHISNTELIQNISFTSSETDVFTPSIIYLITEYTFSECGLCTHISSVYFLGQAQDQAQREGRKRERVSQAWPSGKKVMIRS